MSIYIDEQAFNTRRAIAEGEDALTKIQQALEHALREVERCQARYQAVPLHEKPRVLNHALSTACTCQCSDRVGGVCAGSTARHCAEHAAGLMPYLRWAAVGTPAAALFAFAPAACACTSDCSDHKLIAARTQSRGCAEGLGFHPE